MSKMILDTSFLIDLARSKPNAIDCLGHWMVQEMPTSISVVSVIEFERGLIELNVSRSRLNQAKEDIDSISVIPLTVELGRLAIEIEMNSKKMGITLSRDDCIIAATAMLEDEVLVTADNDFKHIEGLRVLDY